ncbi:BTB/POZ domain-containing protein [Raphanus sativus]|uniref:BTB/POZ domain-containing protein At3g56230 n=1 Tax=Raphanus sativus TaxID=3726 RepID=A0A6J0LMV8_RAPSA|nr:BTB/POZ domain-containing protein At3g56230 [Raphanus sativus]KAJ4895980.1 BTB/POZ domain-containing protein [Raphanus sativus]
MDCSICTTMPSILRPPRNTICGSCYDGARTIMSLLKKLEGSNEVQDHVKLTENSTVNNGSSLFSSPLFSREPQPLQKVIKWMQNMKETEEEQKKRIVFLSSFVSGFKEELHTDILLKPGDDGPPVPAHRALLASKSEIFKNILDSDECKTAPESITLQELNLEELQALLEFLYTGTLASDKLEKHVYALFVAADKYMIHYLQEFCEQHMLSSLEISSVLDVLDVSDLGSSKTLKEAALGFVVRNMDDIVFTDKYEEFSQKNQHLCVQITRAFLMETRNKRRD